VIDKTMAEKLVISTKGYHIELCCMI